MVCKVDVFAGDNVFFLVSVEKSKAKVVTSLISGKLYLIFHVTL